MRDNNRRMKGQDVKRLARVPGFNTLSNFCVSFTQARFAINSKDKVILLSRKIVLGGKSMYQIDFLVHEFGLNLDVTRHRHSV